jgi:thiamine-phosphate pyrophosphorylase
VRVRPVTLPRLYAIVDVEARARPGLTPVAFAEELLEAGVRLFQLRGKQLESGALLDLATALQAIIEPAGGFLVVNDRADVAAMAGTAGVHVGQDDLSPTAVRAVVGSAAIVGLSTHTTEQIRQALDEPISYIAVGPAFGTVTKDTGYSAVGLDLIRHAARTAAPRGIPVVGIGGITLERARAVIDAGAASVAVISDLLIGSDPRTRARAFLTALD